MHRTERQWLFLVPCPLYLSLLLSDLKLTSGSFCAYHPKDNEVLVGPLRYLDSSRSIHFGASLETHMINNPSTRQEDLGSITGLGRSPEEGNGYPLSYSCLENFVDREAWWTAAHGVTKRHDWVTKHTQMVKGIKKLYLLTYKISRMVLEPQLNFPHGMKWKLTSWSLKPFLFLDLSLGK